MPQVPLNRRFRLIPETYQKDDHPLGEMWLGVAQGELTTWEELFDDYRVVILAEAGAGKTYELEWAARHLSARGRAAFFIRIEDLTHSFETAFEVGTAEAFAAWLEGADEAWFFLDSVDEIRLTEARAFEQALRSFASRVGLAGQRAHVYVSSRPYAWRPQRDRALLEELLPFDSQTTELSRLSPNASVPDTQISGKGYSTTTTDNPLPALQLYQLASLETEDIRTFAEYSGVSDTTLFLEELERGHLFQLARLPFDLRDLISTWNVEHALANRLTILQESVKRQLSQAVSNIPSLTLPRMEEGAQLLALCVILTGVSNLRLQGTATEEAIQPGVLLKDWSSLELNALLTSGIFGEPVYGEVRFRHREIRELLAARWISNRLGSEANRSHIEQWLFRSRYGITVLSSRLRPLLPWLILFDEAIRDRIIAEYPEVVLEGGDAAALPLKAREETLSRVIKHMTDATSSLRGLDNSAIVRIARPDLEPLALKLIEKYAENDDVMFILGRLVWQGKMSKCVEPLASIASDPARGVYARLVSVRAVASLTGVERLLQLWQAILSAEGSMPRAIFAELVAHAPPQLESLDLILKTLSRSGHQERYDSTGLTTNLAEFVQRLVFTEQPDSTALLHSFADGLLAYLKQEPHFARGECSVSKAFHWLMPIALGCIEQLIKRRTPAALSPTSLTLLAAVPALMDWHDAELQSEKQTLAALVPKWQELNDALFWWTVTECRGQKEQTCHSLKDDWPVTWPGHFWAFDAASFPRTLAWIQERPLVDDQYVALTRAHRTYMENGKPQLWHDQLVTAAGHSPALQATLQIMLNPPPDSATLQYQEQERRYKQHHARRQAQERKAWDAFVADLKANPAIVRHPPGLQTDEISSIQAQLLEHVREGGGLSKQSEGSNWTVLISEFGPEVAEAYRDATTGFWRGYQPRTRSEGATPNSIPYAVMFGLAGLDIELENERAITRLSDAEVESAMRYALWEINGFPRWFESLYRLHPAAATKILRPEIEWELSTSVAAQPSYYVLHDLVYHAPTLHTDLASTLYRWLSEHQVLNHDCLRYSRVIMTAGGIQATDIALLATMKLADPATPLEQRPVWHAIRTDVDPARSLPVLKALIKEGSAQDNALFGEVFSVALLGGRRDAVQSIGTFKTPSYLKDLYLLVHGVVRVADDLDRTGKGVYSPTLRDDAQDARERLFGLLSELPSELTYRAILELADIHPVPHFRAYMRSCARQRAIADGDLQPWHVVQVARVATRLVLPATVNKSLPEAPHATH
ncbi:hypothetical protein OKW12_002237 [Pseudomonas silensiensis]|nr:hypothetical protein [Pseudomonas silensiensis]